MGWISRVRQNSPHRRSVLLYCCLVLSLQMKVVAVVDQPEHWRAALIYSSPREPALNEGDAPCPVSRLQMG